MQINELITGSNERDERCDRKRLLQIDLYKYVDKIYKCIANKRNKLCDESETDCKRDGSEFHSHSARKNHIFYIL